jgi:hypothetical protein
MAVMRQMRNCSTRKFACEARQILAEQSSCGGSLRQDPEGDVRSVPIIEARYLPNMTKSNEVIVTCQIRPG